MSVVGFEPTTSGFVDQRSKFRCATRTKSGWLELNQREPVPKTGGRPLSHILKKWSRRESNPQLLVCKTSAFPIWPRPQTIHIHFKQLRHLASEQLLYLHTTLESIP